MLDEIKNLEQIARGITPRSGSIPELEGIDVYGETIPLNGVIGGDHIIYVDFKKRYDLDARIREASNAGRPEIADNLEQCRRRAGIVLLDVSGHQATDAMIAAMMHQAFLLGSLYELDMFGRITSRLFENLNMRFHRSSSVNKFVTAIYGEISEDQTFRYLSAAHPKPVVFSAEHDRFMEVSDSLCTSFPPIGTLPSENVVDRTRTSSVLKYKDPYTVNEWKLMGSGDILLLYTDGLLDLVNGTEKYFPDRLEEKIKEVKHEQAIDVVGAVIEDLRRFGDLSDDVSLVVIKRN